MKDSLKNTHNIINKYQWEQVLVYIFILNYSINRKTLLLHAGVINIE